MRIIQVAPTIGPGSGVAGVAYHLEREWQRRGIESARFTMSEARGNWLPEGQSGLRGKLSHAARVVWFSTVGTLLARRYLDRHPGSVSICHNDALAGDVYVNHGILAAAMQARGHYMWRMVRNPLHLFTMLRDGWRYGRRGPHRLVVNLSTTDDRLLHRHHPGLRTQTTVIGNGVDLDTFLPPTRHEREAARLDLGLTRDDVAMLFVGHEFDRKGLPVLLEALSGLPPHFKLLVVGGTPGMVDSARAYVGSRGLGARVQFLGGVADPRPFLWASDMFALPSAYEAYPLVVLEALACGVPVVASPTGSIPDLVQDGRTGFVVPAEPSALRAAIIQVAALLGTEMSRECRLTAERRSWAAVADEYLRAFAGLGGTKPAHRGNA
jgi:glycosyltransferase involved in cell wall biosynthesis